MRSVKLPLRTVLVLGALLMLTVGFAYADASGDPKAVRSQKGEYFDKDGAPTYHIENGKVDWYTYIGFERYGANCLQCHGPDGLGSSYAPSLVDALKNLSYAQFLATVAQGKKDVSASSDLVMPTFGQNKNVMCFINEIYVYLRARSNGSLGRGRPTLGEQRPAGYSDYENECLG
jgi:methanol metabolism-related c-type cytochrome